MKVKELIALLQKESPESDVHYSYPSGDYWRSQLAPAVSRIKTEIIIHSGYHDKPQVVDADEHDEGREVLVLS